MKGFLVGNEEVLRDRSYEVINPANEQVIDRVSLATLDDAKNAIETAKKAFDSWSSTPLHKRIELLYKLADYIASNREDFARILALEAGKPIRDARVEATRTEKVFRYSAEAARYLLTGELPRLDAFEYPAGNEKRMAMIKREPMGVVVAITPFNFPLNSFAHKVAPALAVGNTVVVKPSLSTPLSALNIANIMLKLGFPPGVVNVITGYSSEIGDLLITHEDVSLITFTGSTEVGLKIASKAAGHSKRMIMELGGSDPMIILDDADIEKASTVATRARFEYAGQNCNSAKRIFVQEKVFDKFLELFKEKTAKLKLGNPMDESTDVGPVISSEAIKNMESYIEDAKNKESEVVLGGIRPYSRGYFLAPTILKAGSPDIKALNEEVFGPVAPVMKVKDEEEASFLANKSKYGLQAAIFTSDYKKALKIADKIKTGAVIINDSTRLRWDALPFGGVRYTGFGREGVKYTMQEMTELKLIALNLD